MRPLFSCGWPLNFPIRDGVFYHIPYNLGTPVLLFINMQIWRSETGNVTTLELTPEVLTSQGIIVSQSQLCCI